MSQNSKKYWTFPNDTLENTRNNNHCMTVTTRIRKQLEVQIEPIVVDVNNEVLEKDNKEQGDRTDVVDIQIEMTKSSYSTLISSNEKGNQKEVHKILSPIPRPPSPFPQHLKKHMEYEKFHMFISILRRLFVNIPLVEALSRCLDMQNL